MGESSGGRAPSTRDSAKALTEDPLAPAKSGTAGSDVAGEAEAKPDAEPEAEAETDALRPACTPPKPRPRPMACSDPLVNAAPKPAPADREPGADVGEADGGSADSASSSVWSRTEKVRESRQRQQKPAARAQ